MQALNELVQQAKDTALGQVTLSANEAEVARQLQICNACRYCESFCAVFPAMTRRLSFEKNDIHYMANLCHSCGSCLHACQYADPHEFQVNIPKSMAKVRLETYQTFAWPKSMGKWYQHNGLWIAICLTVSLAFFITLIMMKQNALVFDGTTVLGFYDVLSHNALVSLFAPIFIFDVIALSMGLFSFLSKITPVTGGVSASGEASLEATQNMLTLKYLDGGHGEGCNNEDDAFTLSKRRAHHLTFYGFMLCFASTSVATFYHYTLNLPAPYDLSTLPKMLGVLGGVTLLVGASWLAKLNLSRHKEHGDAQQKPMDLGFIALLIFASLSGLLLWLLGKTVAMPLLFALHLGSIMALFLTLPYGKFAHGFYRGAALLRFAVEKRQPSQLILKED
jgi:citrate/tricarballylate utilization protein